MTHLKPWEAGDGLCRALVMCKSAGDVVCVVVGIFVVISCRCCGGNCYVKIALDVLMRILIVVITDVRVVPVMMHVIYTCMWYTRACDIHVHVIYTCM